MQLYNKRYLLAAVAGVSLVASSIAVAGTTSYNNYFDGPILGISGGYDWGNSTQVTNSPAVTPSSDSKTASHTQEGWQGNAFAGYGYGFDNNFYLGGRVRASAFTSDQVAYRSNNSDNTLIYKDKFSPLYGGALEVQPGYIFINRYLVYLNGGLGSDRYKFKETQTAISGITTSATDNDNKEWVNEAHVGAGVSFAINHWVSTGIEYDRVFSQQKTMGTNPITGQNIKLQPEYNTAFADITAHFK